MEFNILSIQSFYSFPPQRTHKSILIIESINGRECCRECVCIKYRESASHGFVASLLYSIMCYHIDYDNTNHVKFIKIFNNKFLM